jgi:hypothetical protein
MSTALRWAPVDALLWTEYALALARINPANPTLATAVERAQRLAPTSPAVQASLAELGLSLWAPSSPALRERWLQSMKYQIKHARGAFLGAALMRGQVPVFCAGPASLMGELAWCESNVPALSKGCFDVTPQGPVPCTTVR